MKLTTGFCACRKLFVSSRTYCVVALVALSLSIGPSVVDAAMLDIGGVFSGAESDGDNFVLVSGFATQSETDDLLPFEIGTANVGDLSIDLSAFITPGGEVGVSNLVLSGRPVGLGGSGGAAEFAITNASLTQVLTTPISIAYILADVELVSNTTLADLSGFADGSSIVISLNGVDVSPGSTGGSADLSRGGATASFTLSAVPEPSTLVLATLALVSLLGFRRRRRR